MLSEGADLQARAARKIAKAALAIGFGGSVTEVTVSQIMAVPVDSVLLDRVGHYVALEAPDLLAEHD